MSTLGLEDLLASHCYGTFNIYWPRNHLEEKKIQMSWPHPQKIWFRKSGEASNNSFVLITQVILMQDVQGPLFSSFTWKTPIHSLRPSSNYRLSDHASFIAFTTLYVNYLFTCLSPTRRWPISFHFCILTPSRFSINGCMINQNIVEKKFRSVCT